MAAAYKMKFQEFFNYQLNCMRVLGYRFQFGSLGPPKWLAGEFHFWSFVIFQIYVVGFDCFYMTMTPSIQSLLMGFCNIIYVLETCFKAHYMHYNTDKIDQMLHNLHLLYETTEDQNKYFLLINFQLFKIIVFIGVAQFIKYYKIIMFYTKYVFFSGFMVQSVSIITLIVSYIISGEIKTEYDSDKFEPSSQIINIFLLVFLFFCAPCFSVYSVLDSLMLVLALHLIIQLKQISKELEILKSEPAKKGFISILVNRHEKTLK